MEKREWFNRRKIVRKGEGKRRVHEREVLDEERERAEFGIK